MVEQYVTEFVGLFEKEELSVIVEKSIKLFPELEKNPPGKDSKFRGEKKYEYYYNRVNEIERDTDKNIPKKGEEINKNSTCPDFLREIIRSVARKTSINNTNYVITVCIFDRKTKQVIEN